LFVGRAVEVVITEPCEVAFNVNDRLDPTDAVTMEGGVTSLPVVLEVVSTLFVCKKSVVLVERGEDVCAVVRFAVECSKVLLAIPGELSMSWSAATKPCQLNQKIMHTCKQITAIINLCKRKFISLEKLSQLLGVVC